MIEGSFDGLTAEALLTGWFWDSAKPDKRVSLLVSVNDNLVGKLSCNQPRLDLIKSGVGDGSYGMPYFKIDDAVSGDEIRLGLFDGESGASVWGPANVRIPAALVEGCVDSISSEGVISGWCWNATQPNDRLTLEILADGIPVLRTIAGGYRSDLTFNGRGTGRYAFSAVLPWGAIDGKARVSVVVRDASSGAIIGDPIPFRRPGLGAIADRLSAMEWQVGLLEADIKSRLSTTESLNAKSSTRQDRAGHDPAARLELGVASSAQAPLAGMANDAAPVFRKTRAPRAMLVVCFGPASVDPAIVADEVIDQGLDHWCDVVFVQGSRGNGASSGQISARNGFRTISKANLMSTLLADPSETIILISDNICLDASLIRESLDQLDLSKDLDGIAPSIIRKNDCFSDARLSSDGTVRFTRKGDGSSAHMTRTGAPAGDLIAVRRTSMRQADIAELAVSAGLEPAMLGILMAAQGCKLGLGTSSARLRDGRSPALADAAKAEMLGIWALCSGSRKKEARSQTEASVSG